MPKKRSAEFYWSEKLQLYRKRVKDPLIPGKWHDVWGKTKAVTREKARAKEAELAAEKRRVEMPFFAEYAATWYALHAPQVGSKTQQNWRTAINKHICPAIGTVPLEKLTTDDVQSVMAAAASLSHETQKRIRSVLQRILRAAVAAGLMEENPAEALTASGSRTVEKIPLTRKQQQALMDSLVGNRCRVFCALALYAGLRREEITGLMWDCVFLDGVPHISVRRACRWEGNHAVVSEELKSKAARRDIPIPPVLAEILREEKEKSTGDFVVSDAEGNVLSMGSFRRMWKAIGARSERTVHYKANGFEYTRELKVGDIAPYTGIRVALDFKVEPHILRHTYITELILSGANIKTVQYLAGHSDIKITLEIYTHLTDQLPANTQGAVLSAFG